MYSQAEFAQLPGIARIHPQVAYQWTSHVHPCPGGCPRDIGHLWVWHLCDGSLLPNRDRLIPGYYPSWVVTGVQAHTLVQIEPLTIVASVYWPMCCGLHGFITQSRWQGA